MKLSAHFPLDAMITSREAAAHGINNYPDEAALLNMKKYLAPGCERARIVLNSRPMIETSGYRCPELNCITNGAMTVESLRLVSETTAIEFVREYALRRIAKGNVSASNSQHMLGLALDFISPAFGTPWAVCQELVNSGLVFDQLIYEYGQWVHISFSENPRKLVMSKLYGQPYKLGLHKE